MPTEQRYQLMTSAFKVFLFLFFSVFLSIAHAASLGKLTVLSSLGQPLRAEVELLSVSADEAETLTVKLAPGEAYRKSGIDYNPLLESLTISVEKEGKRNVVKVHSTQPVTEPYIGVLLELAVNGERKGREYIVFLDPAEWTNLRSAPLSSSASMQELSRQQHAGKLASRRAASAPVARPVSVLREQETIASAEYVVSKGDTLSKIAAKLGARNVSLDQMLVALYRHNPDAFLDNNMNLLREGAVLSVPEGGDAVAVSQKDARRIVRLQATNFRQYSHQLAGMVLKSAPEITTKTGQVAEGKITTHVKEVPTPASKSPDRLELSKAQSEKTEEGARFSVEEKIALNKAIEDANQRITELEKNVTELRSLLEIVSKNEQVLAKPAEAIPDAEEKTALMQLDDAVQKAETIEKTSEPEVVSEEGLSADQTLAESENKAEKQKNKEDEDENEEKQKEEKPGFLHQLKNNLLWQVVIGVTAALLVLIAFLVLMRRKKTVAPPSKPVVSPPPKKDIIEEEVNPNIISGREFLENLTGREVLESEEEYDEDAGSYSDEIENNEPAPAEEERLFVVSEGRAEDADYIHDIPEEMAVQDKPVSEEIPVEIEKQEDDTVEIDESEEDEPEAIEGIAEVEETEESEEGLSEAEARKDVIKVGEVEEGEEVIALADVAETLMPELALEGGNDRSDSENKTVVNEEEPPPLELDLSDINLEPDIASTDDLPEMVRSNAKNDLPESPNAEIAAKLELALAYMDMKDKDGARELLEEVIERGTAQQVTEAQQILQYL